MKRFLPCSIVACLFVFLLSSCSKETAEFTSNAPEEYFNLTPGKYIRYYLDSSRFIFFGQKDTVIHYQAKDVVDSEVMDAGRRAWRIIRYLRDANSNNENEWVQNMSYLVVPTRESVEVVEGNLRQVKLKLPVTEGFQWRGNSYLPDNPFRDIYPFNNDVEIQLWDYTYDVVGGSAEINNKLYENVTEVTHIADSVNVPIDFANAFALKNYWVEKYELGVGLVYKEVSMWDYQPPTGGNPGYRTGFGIRMSIIDHN